ncbi:uncharacterized protein VNE69_06178 [Vairimorpha necatrix]|uniref:Uncharacterized protein n=1 Tax=Vairimorpha necatrix TaxID=6039 RepID=A0AAX4JDL9_9MICR
MILIIFFSIFLVVQPNIAVFNEIKDTMIRKIKCKDYLSFDPDKKYNLVSISKNKNEKTENMIRIILSIGNVQPALNYTFYVYCDDKSINVIIDEMEISLKRLLNFPYSNAIILMYEEGEMKTFINNDKSITIGDVIEYMKQANNIRKDGYEIYYENIYLMNSLLAKTIHKKEIYDDKDNTMGACLDIIFKYTDKPMYFIKFYVQTKYNYNLFDICIENPFKIVDLDMVPYDTNEIEIIQKLVELNKLSHDNFERLYLKAYIIPIYSTSNIIEILYKGLYFKIELDSEKIRLKYNDIECFIYLEDGFCRHVSKLNDPSLYLIQICVLLEAESYVNETNVSEDSIYKNLKDIYNLIETKKNIQKNIDLIKTMKELAGGHFDNFKKYKENVYIEICAIASLFCGLNKNTFFKHDTRLLSKSDICSSLNLDENEIQKNIESIRSKLRENYNEDIKYENLRNKKKTELKEAAETLEKHPLNEKLKEILKKAHNTNLINNDMPIEDFESKLVNKSIKIIDKIIYDPVIIEKIDEE